jgi:hypothetical protein
MLMLMTMDTAEGCYRVAVSSNKSQITMSKITNSPIGLDKKHHVVFFAEGV